MDNSIQKNKEAVRRFNKEVIEEGNLTAFNELVSEEVINHAAPADAPAGPESMRHFLMDILRKGFSDIKVDVLEQVAEKDLVTSRKKIHVRHTGEFLGVPASGKTAVIDVIDIIRLKDGRYAEHWGISNIPDVIGQLKK
jgi:predicted SnoaL-like aldol condensation-catalyzing enzyme